MEKFEYQIKPSAKAHRIRIIVYPDGKVIVTKPKRVADFWARQFVHRKSGWIRSKLDYYERTPVAKFADERSKDRAEALEFVKSRIAHFNAHYKFAVGKVSIKDHKSLWGSCSARHNLNFNHKIVELTPKQADYIIVHELCHIGEFNHSQKFWDLVAQTIPNFLALKKELRRYSFY